MGGVRGEEVEVGWTGAPEGWLEEGKGSHPQRGKLGDHWEDRGSKGSMATFPLPTWAPRKPTEILGLILCPPRPPPATWVLREREGEKGDQK